MRVGDRLYECQPETGRAACTGVVCPPEALERVRKKGGRKARSLVRDAESDATVKLPGREPHRARAISQRIVDEVAQCLLEPQPVAGDGEAGRRVDLEATAGDREPARDRVQQLCGRRRPLAAAATRPRPPGRARADPLPAAPAGRSPQPQRPEPRAARRDCAAGGARARARLSGARAAFVARDSPPRRSVAPARGRPGAAREPVAVSRLRARNPRPTRAATRAGRRAGAASARRRARRSCPRATRRPRRRARRPVPREDACRRARRRASRAAARASSSGRSKDDAPVPGVASRTSPPGASTWAKLSSLSARPAPASGEPPRTRAATSSTRVRSVESICSSSAEPSRT